jgi:hypothetical protein
MFKNIYNYITNVGADIMYGYIEVKCANRDCKAIYKFTRNSLNMNNINNYCCRMGCALAAYKQMSIV